MITMAETERIYNVPLRQEFRKAPTYKKAKKASKALKEFIAKHMKSDDVKIGRILNMKIWERGIKNPPHHVKVTAIKDDNDVVRVELFGYKYEQPTKEEIESLLKEEEKKQKPSKKKTKEDKKLEDDLLADVDQITGKRDKSSPKKEVPKVEVKAEVKEEVKVETSKEEAQTEKPVEAPKEPEVKEEPVKTEN